MNKKTINASDIIVKGDGIVSLLFALSLQSGLGDSFSILIITNKEFSTFNDKKNVRTISISLSTVNMLRALGIWESLVDHTQCINEIIVSSVNRDNINSGYLNFNSNVSGEAASYTIEEHILRDKLLSIIGAKRNIRFINTEVDSILHKKNTIQIITDEGSLFETKLFVASDGRKSKMRSLFEIKDVGWDYNQASLSAVIEHSKKHNGIATEIFYSNGPFAILPMRGNRSSMIWTMPKDEIHAYRNTNELFLKDKIKDHFGYDRGEILHISNIGIFELYFQISRKLIGKRFALMGDAAHTVHPLAGQGLNIGLRDAATLAEKIVDAVRYGFDFGSSSIVEEYEKDRRFDIVSSALAYDSINKFFTNKDRNLHQFGKIGLGVIEKMPWVKNMFVREASGLNSSGARLTRGEAL
ncbi:MAG: FAD-dependent monooxygenase [Alphaproteobacteria bacterium]|jgi:2-octaprenyl-6-methoxyphenol hydroxylase